MTEQTKLLIKTAFDAQVEALGTTDKTEVEALFGDATTVRELIAEYGIEADALDVAAEIDNLIDQL